MSEHIHEQISAFLDDELSAEESAFLARRLTSDVLAHRQTVRYAAIGSALRGEIPAADSRILRDRIQAVLDGVPQAQSPTRLPSKRPARWAKAVAGVSIAASVAIAALFWLRTMNVEDPMAVPLAAGADGNWAEPSSYVVPGDLSGATPVISAPPPIELTNLIIQHVQFTSNANRTSAHSAVISRSETEAAELHPADAEAPQ